MKKNLIKTLSLVLVTSSLLAVPTFAAEKPQLDTKSIITPQATMTFPVSITKSYPDTISSIPTKIWYDNYIGGVRATGYLYQSKTEHTSSGYFVVTYSGTVVGHS